MDQEGSVVGKDPGAPRRHSLLTEQEVARSWRRLMQSGKLTAEVVSRAEALIDNLQPESPLRHRLITELEEIRKLKAGKTAVGL